ncbi:hypothetical protein GN956_G18554 [Arapaima gigas]
MKLRHVHHTPTQLSTSRAGEEHPLCFLVDAMATAASPSRKLSSTWGHRRGSSNCSIKVTFWKTTVFKTHICKREEVCEHSRLTHLRPQSSVPSGVVWGPAECCHPEGDLPLPHWTSVHHPNQPITSQMGPAAPPPASVPVLWVRRGVQTQRQQAGGDEVKRQGSSSQPRAGQGGKEDYKSSTGHGVRGGRVSVCEAD